MKNIIQELYEKGILRVEIEWNCGGDDGSITGIRLFPKDRHIREEVKDALSTIGWKAYEDIIGGGTNGNFSNDGKIVIYTMKNGSYKAHVINYYTDQEENVYDKNDNLIHEAEAERTEVDLVTIDTTMR